jgi:hypothetical protein
MKRSRETVVSISALRLAGLAVVLVSACLTSEPVPARAEIRKTDASHVAIVPAKGQLPYCLVFAAGPDGVVRLQTVTYDDLSIECEAGEPIGGQVFDIPSHDDPFRLFVIFSDRTIQAASIAQQIRERLEDNAKITPMDLRAPGKVTMEVIEVLPSKLREMK